MSETENTETISEEAVADSSAEATTTDTTEAPVPAVDESTADAPVADAAETDGEVADSADATTDEVDGDAEAAEAEPEPEDPFEAFRKELRGQLGKWYVVHSYAGFEKRVKTNIEARQHSESLPGGDQIYQVEVPMEEVLEVKNGARKLVNRVRIPGYVLVRMELNEDSWSLVRHTPGVTGFVGNAYNPTPLRLDDAFSMLKGLVETPEIAAEKAVQSKSKGGKSKAKNIPAFIDFEVGETITIKEGSFQGLPGSISEIKPESGKLTVLVSLFERETPVELSFDQVTKL